MDQIIDKEAISKLEELFCSKCSFLERRQNGRCPKGQTTCGAQINEIYQLKHGYSNLSPGIKVRIRDIFWSVKHDYATVTIATMQNNRFGVAWTLLEEPQ